MSEALQGKNGKELKVGTLVHVPFRVVKIGGHNSPLVHLESVEAYGHENKNAPGPLKGKTKTAFWVEPGQVDVVEAAE